MWPCTKVTSVPLHGPLGPGNFPELNPATTIRLATGESSATTLVKEISVSKAIENLEAAQQRDDTQ